MRKSGYKIGMEQIRESVRPANSPLKLPTVACAGMCHKSTTLPLPARLLLCNDTYHEQGCQHSIMKKNMKKTKISDEKPEDLGISQTIFLFEENH